MNSNGLSDRAVKTLLLLVVLVFPACIHGQDMLADNERSDPEYCRLKEDALAFFENAHKNPTSSMENVIAYRQGGFAVLAVVWEDSTVSPIDSATISFLHRKKIPLTLFPSGTWINANVSAMKQLSTDSMFEIENGGLTRGRLLNKNTTVSPNTKRLTPADCVDEIELNARKIYEVSHTKVLFYLPSENTPGDEIAVIACYLNEYIFMPDIVLSDDDSPNELEKAIDKFHSRSVVVLIRSGRRDHDLLISTASTLQAAGFSMVKLEHLVN